MKETDPRNRDMLVIIHWVFGIFAGLALSVVVLEAVSVFMLKKQVGTYLDDGLLLALFAYLAGYASAIVTFFFVKKAQEDKEQQ